MKYTYVLFCLLLAACNNSSNESASKTDNVALTENVKPATVPEQLNITLILDLSDRIDTVANPAEPQHYQRDMAVVKHFAELFVKEMEKIGAYNSKGKIEVIFSPRPLDPNINILAEKLKVDLSMMDIKHKKDIHDNLVKTFTDNLNKIYDATLKEKKWIGSDIWRFFKNDVKDYCIVKDSNYRNVVVLITDGYIYHKDSQDKILNRYAYILPKLFTQYKLRDNNNWMTTIQEKDFGLITSRKDLEKLEVLVLEVSPSTTYKNDEDIIKNILSKWFAEMKVKRSAIHNSDLPVYTQGRIDDFMNVK